MSVQPCHVLPIRPTHNAGMHGLRACMPISVLSALHDVTRFNDRRTFPPHALTIPAYTSTLPAAPPF